MMDHNEHANHCIRCTVHECKYHSGKEDYCSLDSIRVASHEENPTDERCVDCRSFACRQNDRMFS